MRTTKFLKRASVFFMALLSVNACTILDHSLRARHDDKGALYYSIKQVVREEKADLIYDFPCFDSIADLMPGQSERSTRHTEIAGVLVFSAFHFSGIEKQLISDGNPENLVRSWISEAESSLLDVESPDFDTARNYFLQVYRKANAYSRAHGASPNYNDQVWGDCGGPLDTTIFQGEGLRALDIIPRGLHKLCSRYWKVNPDSLEECQYWRSVSVKTPREEPVAGWYRYRAVWDDGSVTYGYVDMDYALTQFRDTTVIERR